MDIVRNRAGIFVLNGDVIMAFGDFIEWKNACFNSHAGYAHGVFSIKTPIECY